MRQQLARTQTIIASLLLTVFLMLASGCMRFTPDAREHVIAKVNEEIVLLSDFEQVYQQLKNDRDSISQKNPKLIEELKSRALNEVIVSTILKQETKKNQITIAKEEVEARLSSWKDGYPPGGFEEMLKKQSLTEPFLKRRIREQLAIEKLVSELFRSETLIPNDELKEHYKKNKKKYRRPARVRAYQIVVSTKEEALKIRQEIISKKLSFQSAARKYSLTPDASKGGDLGFFSKDEKIPAFNAAFKLTVGQISEPVKSKYGVHLLTVKEKLNSKRLSFNEAKSEVNRQLKRQKEMEIYKDWMTNLLREGKIFRNDAVYASIL